MKIGKTIQEKIQRRQFISYGRLGENRIPRTAIQCKPICKKKGRRRRRTWFNGIQETMEKDWRLTDRDVGNIQKKEGNAKRQEPLIDIDKYK